ncbi:magnesium transporter MRS2-F isoform X1 [Amborella trichopoda]|uniref:magnesium transporter MRS2-F isoform X1 n=1 Tax=Amborella trichopoda TaxID=13333 RepID=UPI0009BDA0D9|nr:magnesium transporter MRS2-F isoform X1 [Amborella trichopoda]|eukprot:XP_020524483.1 magnesium transporter MRS2-F isoform X1 [Amborella trichopoda]
MAEDEAVRVPGGPRRKGATGLKPWLVITASGQSHLEEVGKHSIMRRTGLPARDLRVLDPALSYPSTILGRERAIVINLEHIRAVITAAEVLVLNSKDPLVAPFVHDLLNRVSESNGTPRRLYLKGMGNSATDMNGMDKAMSQFPHYAVTSPLGTGVSSLYPVASEKSFNGTSKVLPFEFTALEVCLEYACRGLESEASALEKQAYPALDELTSKISSLNLDRVRQIKSRLVAISGRVQKVRDELEHLLDDDADMAEMYLTDKLVQQSMDGISSRDELVQDEINSDEARDEESDSNNGKNITGVESSRGFKLDIEDLEMLLEAYFVQIDGTLNKLSALREYVDDTEDYINIMLDDKQNQLLQMGVMLTTATLIANAGIVVVGLFGMNIHISLFDAGMAQFMQATCGTIGACGVLYVMAIGWGKRNGLLA